jgi:hypothetical protein
MGERAKVFFYGTAKLMVFSHTSAMLYIKIVEDVIALHKSVPQKWFVVSTFT